MNHNQTYGFWRLAALCLLGGVAVALVTFVCFRLNVSITTAALLYLIVVVLASLMASFVLSAVVSIIAILCLDYFFTEPFFTLDVTLRQPLNVVAVITFLGTALVITSLTAKVRKSFQVLREQAGLLDLTHDTIFVRDLNDVITYWNRGAAERYGWTREEAIGRVSHQLMQTIFRVPLEEINVELRTTGRWEGELVHTKRDRTQVVVASRWSLQRDEHGEPAAILETNNDITERKRAEEALRKSEEQWKAIFEDNPTMYFMVDAAGTVLSVNPFGAEQLGYTVDELVGQSVLEVFYKADRGAAQRNVAICLEQFGRTMSWELRKIRKNGTVLWVRETAKAMRRANSDPVALIVCEDITERKRAQEALHKTQAELAHVTRVTTLGEMTASIAHEINQPLAAVVNNASASLRWLAANNLEEARQSVQLIIADGHRAAEIINRIRALAKKAPPQKEWMNINETIAEIIALAHSEIQRNRVSLQTQLSSDVAPILGDRIQLQQVILNLIMNAIEAMSGVGENARKLLISSEKDASQGVVVAVRDSGPGLDPESLGHLFNAFYSTKPQGMGMGLAISRSIIEAHGGRLWATTNESGGAVFQFTLPTGEGLS
jgi:PAS domain S-box-containing protein